jgi:hypothetical protein
MTDNDPIVAEVRAIRDAYAAKFNYDLKAIAADLKRQAQESSSKNMPLRKRAKNTKSKKTTKRT